MRRVEYLQAKAAVGDEGEAFVGKEGAACHVHVAEVLADAHEHGRAESIRQEATAADAPAARNSEFLQLDQATCEDLEAGIPQARAAVEAHTLQGRAARGAAEDAGGLVADPRAVREVEVAEMVAAAGEQGHGNLRELRAVTQVDLAEAGPRRVVRRSDDRWCRSRQCKFSV